MYDRCDDCELCRPETANRPLNLAQDASGGFYPDFPKDDTMTSNNENTEALRDAIVHEFDDWPPARVFLGGDQPAWATDPLPPAVLDRAGRIWLRARAQDTYFGLTPVNLERDYGPCVPLWPETPTTSPLPDLSRWHPVPVGTTVPRGTEWAMKFADGTHMTAITSAAFVAEGNGRPIYTEHPIAAPDEPSDAEVEAFKRAWESIPAGEPGARTRAGLKAAFEARR